MHEVSFFNDKFSSLSLLHSLEKDNREGDASQNSNTFLH